MDRQELIEKLKSLREKNLRLTQTLSAVYDVAASKTKTDEQKVDEILEIVRWRIGDRE